MSETKQSGNFIHSIIDADLKDGKNDGRVHTRFPPEPNGYLHIGHAKAITVNFQTAIKYGGKCNLRFDDTNPTKEDDEYVEAIKRDVKWLGYDWEDRLYFASDYFEGMANAAIDLIKEGKAYVDDLSAEEIRAYRGTLTEKGKSSPYRDRSVDENLSLFFKMRNGEFEEGSRVLRAKINVESPNLNMRDPVIYRIVKSHHHRQGDKWCIYPMYDFAHPLEDAFEGITHSLCSLEFEDHRPLYDWVIENVNTEYKPRQIEFARLNLSDTIMSKRELRKLVEEDKVSGWDDPRMPTIAGLRRRGYTSESIKSFCESIGVAKSNSVVDIAMLEHAVREDLNIKAQRLMAVLDPIKVIITNFEGPLEFLKAENNPNSDIPTYREIPFGKELYIEREDFMEVPTGGFHRLYLGGFVRLKHAYIIKCEEVIKDSNGLITELRCLYYPESKSGSDTSGIKVKGVIHWVESTSCRNADVRLFDSLFCETNGQREFNDSSLKILRFCKVENYSKWYKEQHFQFLRLGYFVTDLKDFTSENLIFNRVVSLKDNKKVRG